MANNPQGFDYFTRGESPPANKGSGATVGFDYWSRGEAYPAAIPAGTATHSAAAVLSGAGDLTCSAARTTFVATTIAGTGDLSAGATRATFAVSAISGAGDLAASAARTALVATALSGAGDLIADATRTALVAAILSGTGDLTAVALTPPAPTDQGTGYKVQHPTYRQARRTRGRATIRLRVTMVTWGAEAEHPLHHTLAVATATAGAGQARATTRAIGDMRTRHAGATNQARHDLGAHIGDPKEDDPLIAVMLAALLEDRTTT